MLYKWSPQLSGGLEMNLYDKWCCQAFGLTDCFLYTLRTCMGLVVPACLCRGNLPSVLVISEETIYDACHILGQYLFNN